MLSFWSSTCVSSGVSGPTGKGSTGPGCWCSCCSPLVTFRWSNLGAVAGLMSLFILFSRSRLLLLVLLLVSELPPSLLLLSLALATSEVLLLSLLVRTVVDVELILWLLLLLWLTLLSSSRCSFDVVCWSVSSFWCSFSFLFLFLLSSCCCCCVSCSLDSLVVSIAC